jgi:hypothetical protein
VGVGKEIKEDEKITTATTEHLKRENLVRDSYRY